MDISNIKRSVLIIIVISVVVFLIMLLVFAAMAKRNEVGFRNPVIIRENPTVTFVVGDAEYKKKSGSSWESVEIGAVLKKSGSVKTGKDGIVDIRFSDGTAVRIAEDSLLSIQDVSLTNIDIGLEKGTMISKFTKLFGTQKFSVKTPAAVAGIRGTELIFNVSSGGTKIAGMSGITEVYNPKYPEKRVLLGFQSKTSVPPDESPKDPVALSMEEVRAYRNMLDSIHTNKTIIIGKPIQFKPDTAEILESSRKDLEKLAKKMRWRRFKVEIDGHTADIGDSASQYSLSLKRAETIRDYLVSLKIKKSRLIVRGFGGSKPIASNETPEGRAKNRRVEFLILSH